MLKIRLTLFLFLISSTVFAQKNTLVQVVDIDTETPIEMAVLFTKNPDYLVRTDAKGFADISDLVEASRIEIRAFNYVTITTNLKEIQSNNNIIKLQSSTLEIDKLVVSATRWEQSSNDIPNKITLISSKEVALQNPQTAADLLGSSGEVFIQKSQQGGGSPMIRGFSTNRLLYAVDGVRMNNAIFRGGNLQNVISLDPLAVENTEVFFGSGAVVYGSDAIGAVMSFKTLRPILSTTDKTSVSGKALARYSTANNENTFHFDGNVGWKKWAFLTSITYSDYDDLRMGKYGPEEYLRSFYVERVDTVDLIVPNDDPMIQRPTGYSQVNLMNKLRFSPNKRWDFQYAFHFSETSSYSRYDRLIELDDQNLPTSAVWKYGPQGWMMNQLSIDHKGDKKVFDHMSIRMAHQIFKESRINRNFMGSNANRLRTQAEQVAAYSLNIDFEKEFDRHKFYYGIEGVLNEVTSEASAVHIITGDNIPVADRYPTSNWSSYGIFLNYNWDVNENFILQAGSRLNFFSLSSDFSRNMAFYPFDFNEVNLQNQSLTGNVGFVYRPNKTLRIAVNGSTGFRAPNVDDIGKLFDINSTEVVVPNNSLRPENAYTGELNIAKVFKKRVKLDVSGFYTYLDGAMVRRAFKVNGEDSVLYEGTLRKAFAIQNASFGTVYGFNAGMEVKISKKFSLSTRYNYQLGQEELADGTVAPSRHAAPAFGVTRFNFKAQKLRMQVYAMYSAEVSNKKLNPEERQKLAIYATNVDGLPYSPSWYTLNFKAMFDLNKNFSISAGVENITDQRYRPYSSGLVAAGRNFIFTLRATN